MKRLNKYALFMVVFAIAVAVFHTYSAEQNRGNGRDTQTIVGGGAGWADANGVVHFNNDVPVGTFKSIVLCIKHLFRRDSFGPRMTHEQRMEMLAEGLEN